MTDQLSDLKAGILTQYFGFLATVLHNAFLDTAIKTFYILLH